MKKNLTLIIGLCAALSAGAATYRVNNTPGSGAQFSTYAEAEAAASPGDVIIFDGSPTSYGDIVVKKKLTLKGPGYFLDENNATAEGTSPAKFNDISVQAEGTTLTGLYINRYLTFKANKIVVTRCYVYRIYHTPEYSYSNEPVENCVIHQNYIATSLLGDSYSAKATNFQITNNIFANAYNLMSLDHATISRNTIISGELDARWLTNCVIENNIAPTITNDSNNQNNSFVNNHFVSNTSKLYQNASPKNDKTIKEVEQELGLDMGAFSGTSPYVLSGLPAGPMIQDIVMPESVVQGENMQVTVKIGVTK